MTTQIKIKDFSYASLRVLSGTLGFDRTVLENAAATAARYYHPFDLQKDNLSKWRHIDNPCGIIKKIQTAVDKKLLRQLILPTTMTGAIAGRSVADNAKFHIGQPCVVSMDLKECFPRTTDKMVFKVFRERLGCSDETASLLTKISTINNRLPQGAPCSPMLANLVLIPFHDAVAKITSERSLKMSFYIDDIAVSGHDAASVISDIERLANFHGHSISHGKTKVMYFNQNQEVTGLTVNEKLSAGRARIDNIRHMIYGLSRQKHLSSTEVRSVWGKISFVKFVCPAQAQTLINLAERVLPLENSSVELISQRKTRRCDSYAVHRDNGGLRTTFS